MTELRKQFEALAYNNKWNICRYPQSDYHNKEGRYCDEFVDGAWWAFQEQQKLIYRFVDIIHNAYMSDGNSSVEIVYDKIQELLK